MFCSFGLIFVFDSVGDKFDSNRLITKGKLFDIRSVRKTAAIVAGFSGLKFI